MIAGWLVVMASVAQASSAVDAAASAPADGEQAAPAVVAPAGVTAPAPSAPSGEPRSALLLPRSPGEALALGLVVGFGAGSFYAGEPRRGVAFAAVDGVLLLGLAGLTIALNEEVVRNDFAGGRSLGHGDRAMTSKEKGLYAASWAAGGLLVASHAIQGVLALHSAHRTNEVLEHFSLAPVGGGAGARLELAF